MRKLRLRLPSSALAIVGICCASAVANAQEPAKGLLPTKPVAPAATNVTTEGFDKIDVKKDAKADDATELQLSAGALTSSGNARLLSFTGSSRFRARRQDNQLTLAFAGNRASSAATPDAPMQTTLSNVQGKARYDRFLGEGFAAFLSLSGRNDRFQGLLLRTNLDPGLAYYFIDSSPHQLWTEVGYDFQHDLRRESNLQAAAAKGIVLDKTDVRHSSRLFLGYGGSINKTVSLTTGGEYLQGLADTKYWRFNWDVALSSTLGSNFSLATTFGLRYDHAPLPGIKNTDTITAVNLVYTLL
jgi:putative salt-induced outer membrane protein YdiY